MRVIVCERFLKFTLVLRLRLIKEKANEANLLTASVCMCWVFFVGFVCVVCILFVWFLTIF